MEIVYDSNNKAVCWLPVVMPPVFTMRGYAKRGICRRRVSVCVCVCLCVCVSVCHIPVLYQNG